MPVMPAVSVSPTCAVPLMVGAPVAGLLDADSGPALTQPDASPVPASLRALDPVFVLHAPFRALIGIAGIGAAGVLYQGVVVPGAPIGTLLTAAVFVGAATLDAVAGDRGVVGRIPGQLNRAALLRTARTLSGGGSFADTAAVGALVTLSSLPAPSVKPTRTLTALPNSASTRV